MSRLAAKPLILDLDDPAATVRSDVGGKAATLAFLRTRGVISPAGFVVTVAGNDAADSDLRCAIDDAMKRLGRTTGSEAERLALAVRSSGVLEDGSDAAFAGQFESHLNVSGVDRCLTAVRLCQQSTKSARVRAYGQARGLAAASSPIAVLVQPMIPSRRAGVAFSVDPTSGATDCVIVESTYGLGLALADGRVEPDRFVIGKADGTVRSRFVGAKRTEVVPGAQRDGTEERAVTRDRAARCSLDDDEACTIARMVVDLEQLLDGPQDVEWAMSGGTLHVLQSRPVTALEHDRVGEQTWSNLNAGEVLPDVVTPMTWSLIEIIDGLLRRTMRRVGIDIGTAPLVGRIAGRAYFNLNTIQAVARSLPSGAQLAERALGGLDESGVGGSVEIPDHTLPSVRAGLLRIAVAMPALALWVVRNRPSRADAFIADLVASRRAFPDEVDGRPTRALVRQFDAIMERLGADDGMIAFSAISGVAYGVLEIACRRWLRQPELTNALLAGQGGVASAEAGLDLWRLAASAWREAEVRSVLDGGASVAALRVELDETEAGRAFLVEFDAFLQRHGHHTRGEIELMKPRWREQPDVVMDLVRAYIAMMPAKDLDAEYRARVSGRETLRRACRQRLRWPWRRVVFDVALSNAVRGSAARENVKSEMVRHLAEGRTLLLEVGRRLVAGGRLDDPNEVFFLTRHELRDATEDEDMDLRTIVQRERTAHEHYQTLDPPSIVRGTFDPSTYVEPVIREGTEVLRGLAVARGVVRGRARVVRHVDDEVSIEAGEILVAPFTDPGWTPFFLPAAGIVMDMGGLLSHGSIVARELGIPAVVNVGPATRIIRTGQMVEVDGDRGEVRILEDES